MSSEMQEKIARALCKRNCIRPWDEQPKVVREGFLSDALAAMKAMREPTEAMVDAGYCLSDYPFATWQHMLIREISIAEGGKSNDL